MKKIITLIFLLIIVIYFGYHKFYKTGKFNQFLDKYPESKYAQMIEYYFGMICELLGKPDSALFRFFRIIDNYYIENFKPAACYEIAKCYEDMKKDIKKALKFYKKTALQYPNTYHGELAKNRYEYLLLIGYKDE